MRAIPVTPSMDMLPLGRLGENERTQIVFDVSDWLEEYPGASISLTNKLPHSSDGYPCTLTSEGDGKYSWTITSAELTTEGDGECQLQAVKGDVVVKGKIYKTKIGKALDGSAEVPDPWESWITELTELQGEAEDAAEDADEAASDAEAYAVGTRGGTDVESTDPAYHNNSKYYAEQAGSSATAAAGSATTAGNKASDSEAYAVGKRGGVDVESGDAAYHNNSKYYSEQAAGSATAAAASAAQAGSKANRSVIAKEYADLTYPVTKGTWCFHDGVLYEANQAISTSEAWTAAHWTELTVEGSTQSVLSEISQVTSATASDIGKALSPKTVSNGHVTEWEYVDTPIGVNSVTPAKTTFVEEHHGDNLFNPDTMLEVGKWVVNNNGKAELGSDQYTTYYGSIIVPVAGLTAVTIKQDYNLSKIYNYFYTDESDNIIASAQPKELINNGYTVTMDGTGKKLWITIQNYAYAQDVGVMIVSGSTAKNYEPYYHYLTIPNLQSDSTGVLQCPSEYYAVVGDTLQIFYRGIINSVYDDAYDVVVRCDIGQAYERFFEVTPVAGDIGTHTLNVKVYTPDHSSIVAFADISLKVVAKMSSPGTEKVVLYVGDNLAESGKAPYEFHRRLSGSGGTPAGDQLSNITFIGSMTKDGTNYEGNGGWTFSKYNAESKNDANMLITCANHGKTQSDQHSVYKDSNNKEWKLETINTGTIKIIRVSASGTLPATGTLTWVSGGDNHDAITYTASEQASGNPFWDSTQQKVDFGTYAIRMGESSIDYVYVLLGWNGGSLVESAYKDTVNTFITNVHTSFPNAKIILMGLEIPAREGLAKNYLANSTYSMYYEMMQRVFSLNKWYKEIADATENVYFLNIAGQFDSKNNMQTATRALNTRNATTETYQSNGVHPADSGYYQIADACYRHFNWLNS